MDITNINQMEGTNKEIQLKENWTNAETQNAREEQKFPSSCSKGKSKN